MNGIEMRNKELADKLVEMLLVNNILTKTTHDTIIRLAPPLVINITEIDQSLDILKSCIDLLSNYSPHPFLTLPNL